MTKSFTGALVLLCFLASGCTMVRPVAPRISMFDWPPLSQTVEKELGDTLVDKGVVRSYDAISVKDPVVASYGLKLAKWTASPGAYVANSTFGTATLYRNPQPIIVKGLLGSAPIEGGIALIPPENGTCRLWIINGGEIDMSNPIACAFDHTTTSEVLPGSFRRELIYNGRSGTTLRFLYRELKDEYMRSPFTQEISYDLNPSGPTEIGFKGARLTVIEASNVKIRYLVTKTFE